jgi:Co/Zn/Cd efflux system component
LILYPLHPASSDISLRRGQKAIHSSFAANFNNTPSLSIYLVYKALYPTYKSFTMALSKSTRISIMLAIDAAFFLLELGVGLAVGSLALMADAFHMVRTPSRIELRGDY